ncbi:hypothetical protein [Methylobacterium oryzisoli]|uniref:hypothetical protein n=1 Tax=Methylobacterium oryzisoli TaxID=3385502 RepID=UPI00389252F4
MLLSRLLPDRTPLLPGPIHLGIHLAQAALCTALAVGLGRAFAVPVFDLPLSGFLRFFAGFVAGCGLVAVAFAVAVRALARRRGLPFVPRAEAEAGFQAWVQGLSRARWCALYAVPHAAILTLMLTQLQERENLLTRPGLVLAPMPLLAFALFVLVICLMRRRLAVLV